MRSVLIISLLSVTVAFEPACSLTVCHRGCARARTPLAKENPLFGFFKSFEPVEVDRDGNVVEKPPPSPPSPDTRDVGEKLFSMFLGDPQQGDVAGLRRTACAPDT